ncbi:DUF1660 family phage protein [Leeuwenhoekiella sp. LLG6367-2.1]|uniref:DUF1660 family phage protein n=1 Tax=Leeuwenhoekiella sp. LLG6367-2.1 TaxID=3160833 RepID=UPI003866729A|tara:strand:- start:1260 stop:1502 length:243 start_codon:yes stop_codon:yes gene_type:complete
MNATPSAMSFFKSLMCRVFGHKYQVSKSYKTEQQEYQCLHCQREFTTDDNGEIQPLTPKLKRINEVMEKFYIIKQERQAA